MGPEYVRFQILTIADLRAGQEVKMPPPYGTFKQALKVKEVGARQPKLIAQQRDEDFERQVTGQLSWAMNVPA
jgi:hypothetical protein